MTPIHLCHSMGFFFYQEKKEMEETVFLGLDGRDL